MKLLVLLVAIIATAQCGFDLVGVYSVSNDCNVYTCPNNYSLDGQYQLVCPQQGANNAQISWNPSTQLYTLELRTAGPTYTGGYARLTFSQRDMVGNSQVQIKLGGGVTLNMMPCFNGPQTSYLCPADPYWNDKTMVAWKSYNGSALNGCSFLLTRSN